MTNIIGIDISKHTIDAYILETGVHQIFANNEEDIAAFINAYGKDCPARVIVEATGPYQRTLHKLCEDAGWTVSVVNPYKARCFAKSAGFLAKTDKVDSKMLAVYGEKLSPAPTPYPSVCQQELESLVRYRDALIEGLKRYKSQLEGNLHSAFVIAMINQAIERLQDDIEVLDKKIGTMLKQHADFQARSKVLETVPGIGKQTIAALQADLPELGTLNRKQVASLAGVAPYLCDSGQFRGRAMIKGGRAEIRKALYMPILTCIRINPLLKRFYKRLKERGKPAKVALIACMRKLLTILNLMLRTNTAWTFEN